MTAQEIRTLIMKLTIKHTNRPSPETMVRIAGIESNFNARAVSPTGARGVFQFVTLTWNAYKRRGDDIFDPEDNTLAAIRLAEDNIRYLEKKLGRSVYPFETYMAHNLGMGGAYRLLSAQRNTLVGRDLIGSKLEHNPAFLLEKGQPITVQQAIDRYKAKFLQLPFASVDVKEEPPHFFKWLLGMLLGLMRKKKRKDS